MVLNLAWRNIWRNKRRTLLTMGAIGFSVFLYVLVTPVQMGVYDTMIELSLRQFYGHAQIQVKGYKEKPTFEKYIKGGNELAQRMRNSGHYEVVAARSMATALIQANERVYGAQIMGVEPQYEKKLSTLASNIIEGRYLQGEDSSEAVIGSALARNLNAHPGDELIIVGQGANQSQVGVIVTIVGIFETKAKELDRGLVQIPLHFFQYAFSMRDGVHAIAVLGTDLHEQAKLLADMRAEIAERPELRVLSWEELIPELRQGIALDRTSGYIFEFILVIVVVFSIFNTFLMSVLERRHEFGLLLALGARPKDIVLMVAQESMLLILIGVSVGFLLAFAIIYHLHEVGLFYPGLQELLAEYNLPLMRIFPNMEIQNFLIGPLVVILTTNIASWIPLLRIHRLKPVDAMRTV